MYCQLKHKLSKYQGLWYNIAQKRKKGKPMRKKGAKGAPTAKAFKKSQRKKK